MAKFGTGQPLRPVGDARLLTGQGRHIPDIDRDGEACGLVLCSPRAHACMVAIDMPAAPQAVWHTIRDGA